MNSTGDSSQAGKCASRLVSSSFLASSCA
uniref:Uncharacterized protein n=1 Tax=Anguilla anguilla TaxID=7936 RepID=A0A0E9T6D9_ANGAN